MSRTRGRNYHRAQKKDLAMASAMDDLIEFEQFREEILPALRKMLKDGSSADDILRKFQAVAAARQVTIAMKEVDSGKALSAIKDILDRTQGRATEKKEVTHKYANLKDEQLDALLLSEGSDMVDEDEPKH